MPPYFRAACLYNHPFGKGRPARIEEEESKTGEAVQSALEHNHFVILTVEANPHISQVHHRMPVLLDDETCEAWLDPTKTYRECFELISQSQIVRSSGAETIKIVEVGPAVNSIRSQSADCILPK